MTYLTDDIFKHTRVLSTPAAEAAPAEAARPPAPALSKHWLRTDFCIGVRAVSCKAARSVGGALAVRIANHTGRASRETYAMRQKI
jgi:hypothetical protein